MDIIQLHFLTPYPASCLVRGQDGRPKMLKYGGVDRARISSASLKRAIRTSPAFQASLDGNLGTRTARVGTIISERLISEGVDSEAANDAAHQVAAEFGKVEDKSTETNQLVFVSHQEIDAATDVARKIAAGELPDATTALSDMLQEKTAAADIAMFGRMFAARSEIRMTAACEVAHPFTVDHASLESDYYVAIDDEKPAEENIGAEFIGEQFFTAGLFYGYARIDMDQLVSNLDGNVDLANNAARSFARGIATVSPVGKKAAFGTHSRAMWMMAERGSYTPRSLAGAFLKPVDGADHFGEAVKLAEGLATSMNTAYGDSWTTEIMNVPAGEGSLDSVLSIFDGKSAG